MIDDFEREREREGGRKRKRDEEEGGKESEIQPEAS
jgi:hypothetical protein